MDGLDEYSAMDSRDRKMSSRQDLGHFQRVPGRDVVSDAIVKESTSLRSVVSGSTLW